MIFHIISVSAKWQSRITLIQSQSNRLIVAYPLGLSFNSAYPYIFIQILFKLSVILNDIEFLFYLFNEIFIK